MGSIADIINKYKAKTATGASPVGESFETGGTGVVRQDLAAQSVAAQNDRVLRNAAADNVAQSTLLDEQRKQSNMQRDNQITSLKQQSQAEKQKYQLSSDKILSDLESNMDKLSTAEKLDQMEAAASHLRLSDEKYRYELADVGRRSRLDDAIGFDEAMKKSVFEDEMDLMRSDLGFKKALDMDDASFRKWLAGIDVDTALAIAASQRRQAGETAMISGVGSAAVTGAGMAMKDRAGTGTSASTTTVAPQRETETGGIGGIF